MQGFAARVHTLPPGLTATLFPLAGAGLFACPGFVAMGEGRAVFGSVHEGKQQKGDQTRHGHEDPFECCEQGRILGHAASRC